MAIKDESPFEIVRGGTPMVVRVRAANGKFYHIRLAHAVFAVRETGAKKDDGTPVFEVKGSFPMDVTEADE